MKNPFFYLLILFAWIIDEGRALKARLLRETCKCPPLIRSRQAERQRTPGVCWCCGKHLEKETP